MLRSVDLNLKPSKMSIAIAKPSGKKIGTKIGKIKDFSNPSLKLSLGRLNEISFTVPYKVERRHKLVDNKIIDKLKNRYLLYVKWNNVSEWFIINEISDSVDDGSEGLSVHAFSLGHELADKLISQISNEEPVTPRTILTTALSSTNWSVGTIDERIINKYRSFDVTETTVLDFLSTIADTYGAILVFDSENRRIDLIHPDNYKFNRGFRISYGHYLQSLSRVSNSDDMTTRLTVSGKDGLGINTINPTGANYIESFAYFMYPFERDANRNVIRSSAYMSDSLCHAILDYEALVESKKGQFSNLLISLSDAQGVLTTKQNELFTLNTELLALQDQIDVLKAAGQDYSELVTKRDAKQAQVNAKKAEIAQVENEIASINSDITSLKNILSIENNFTPDQIHERNYYIIEKTWSDENYTDAQELYDDAKVKFDEIRKPKINLDVTSVNFFNMIEEQRNWDKLYLGDVVTVRHPMININYEVFVTDMEITDDSLNLTIADFQEVRKDEKLLEMLKASYSSSTTVDMNKYKWSKTINDLTEVNEYINSEYDATKRRIIAGVDESVEISNRGIIIRNPNFPNEVIIIQSGVVALSRDNGETWKTAIKPTGIIAERLIGNILIGESLYIENSSGKFRIDTDGITINDMALFITAGDGTTSTVGSKFDEVNNVISEMQTDLNDEIDDVAQSVTNLNNEINTTFKDSVIDEAEKKAIAEHIDSLNAEKKDIDNRYNAIYNNPDLIDKPAEGTTPAITDKANLYTAKTNYNTAHTNLIKAINDAIADSAIIDNERANVESKFSTYSTRLGELSKAFENALNNISDNKKKSSMAYTDGMKKLIENDISDVDQRVSDLDKYIVGSFHDGIIQESEAKAISTYINSLNVEKDDIDKRYTVIYGNGDLTGTPKTDLSSKKTAFDTAHTNLISSINTAISDGKTTPTEKADVDAKFISYRSALANLSVSFENAIEAISANKVENIKIAERNVMLGTSTPYTMIGENRDNQTATPYRFVGDSSSIIGQDFITSFDWEVTSVTSPTGEFYFQGSNPYPRLSNTITVSSTNMSGKVVYKGKVGGTPFTGANVRANYLSTGAKLKISNFKIAVGNKETDWSPAPEDIANDIKDVADDLADLDNYIGNSFKDGIIQESEAKSIATYINSLNAEKIDLDNRYTSIYNNSNLKTASVKTALSTAKTNYNTSHANLITSINNAIADGKTTNAEKTDVDAKFSDYRAKLGALSIAFENAMDDISNQKASDGKSAWAKFSGAGNTLPAGNVTFGNGLTSQIIEQATLNFNNRNDRISTAPRAPVVDKTVSGTVVDAIDHTSNTDGSVNISFEWDFDTSGSAGDIDGFILYIYQGTSSSAYSFGSNQSSEQVYYATNEKRAFILYGVPANRYYTFGVQSYRIVDKDINVSGVLKSSIVKSTVSGHNPYRPSETVAFSGKVTGTIGNNTTAAIIEERSNNALQLGTAYNNVTFSADAGILVNRSDKKIRAILNATDGLKIQKSSDGSTWTNVLYADTNGVLNSQGLKISSVDGASVLIDASNKSIDFSKFTTILGKVKAENVQIGSGTTFDSGYNPSANDTKLRNDLKLTAPLPTSLSLSSSGIKATTSDVNKYAQLDYRGLYIKQGAITIERPDGAVFMQNGLANLNYNVQPMYPSRMESGISVNGYYYMAQGTGNTYNVERTCEAFSMRHEGSVLVVEVNHRLAQGATGAGGFYLRGIDSYSQQYINNGYSFYNQSEGDGYEVVRINLGKPTYQRLTFYLKLKSGSYGSNAYLYVLRMYQEG